MKDYTPTEAQSAFISSFEHRKVLFGSRQIGKTTAVAIDAIRGAVNGNDVAITAPSIRQTRSVLEKCRSILNDDRWENPRNISDGYTSNVGYIDFSGSGTIDCVGVKQLYVCEENMEKPVVDEYDTLYIDEADFIDSKAFDSIVRNWSRRGGILLGITGTPLTNSQNIKPAVESDTWFSVYDTLQNNDRVSEEDFSNAIQNSAPTSAVTEHLGLFVSDPSVSADVVAGDD